MTNDTKSQPDKRFQPDKKSQPDKGNDDLSAEVPKALPTLRRSLQLAHQAEPRLIALSLALALLEAVPDSLFAVWLMLLADAFSDRNPLLAWIGCGGLAVSAVGSWVLGTVAGRVQRTFRLRVGAALEGHVAGLQASIPTLEHQERPDYLDRLSVLKDQVWQLDHMYLAMFSMIGAAVRLIITLVLVMSVNPLFGLLLIFALPTVWVSSRRSAGAQRLLEKVAEHERRHRHFFTLGTTQQPAKEIRIWGLGSSLVRMRRQAWESWYRPLARQRWGTAAGLAAAWVLFAAAYLTAIVLAATALAGTAGQVLLIVTAGSRLSQYVSMTVGEADFLRMWLDSSQRLAWLEAYAQRASDAADGRVPDRLSDGIVLDGVGFCYPGTDRPALEDVSVRLPAGAVIAVVGENGAGKSTLMKLLSRFYTPTAGTITVDGVDLQRLPAEQWRERMAGAYQNFFNFELPAKTSVGVGDLPRVGDVAALDRSLALAGAEDVIAALPNGIDTQLGPTWDDGADLSFGQWQKIALARGFMRDDTLLQVLDEPTAALDAETEHALFESFVAGTRRDRPGAGEQPSGGITLLVSHRFSTVRMADLILVLQGSRLVEVGSHHDLIKLGGLYAELYGIQAAGYR